MTKGLWKMLAKQGLFKQHIQRSLLPACAVLWLRGTQLLWWCGLAPSPLALLCEASPE